MIRRAPLDDVPAVAALHRCVRDACLPYLTKLHSVSEDRCFFRDRVFSTCEVWVAKEAEALSGFCAFRPGWIEHLYILPGCQRQGLGSLFVDQAKQDQARLNLWVFQRNIGAIRFYEKQGFAEIQRTAGSGNEEQEPDVLYEWRPAQPRTYVLDGPAKRVPDSGAKKHE